MHQNSSRIYLFIENVTWETDVTFENPGFIKIMNDPYENVMDWRVIFLSFCMPMWVYIYLRVHAWWHTRRIDDNFRCLSSGIFYLSIETGLLIGLGLCQVDQVGLSTCQLQGFSYICLSCCRCWIAVVCHHGMVFVFNVGSRDSNLGPYACNASTLVDELQPEADFFF